MSISDKASQVNIVLIILFVLVALFRQCYHSLLIQICLDTDVTVQTLVGSR
jgi:hypothetical protein